METAQTLSRVMPVRQSSTDCWEEAGFRALFLQHYSRIVAILRRLLGDRSHAEELANDAFWRLYRNPELQADGNIGGWLYRTATNLGIDALRASQRRQQYEQAAAQLGKNEAPGGPLQELLREEARARVRQALSLIRPIQAQLLLLRSCGFSYKELAESLGLKVTGIGTMLNRAEEEFRRQYLDLYPNEEEL